MAVAGITVVQPGQGRTRFRRTPHFPFIGAMRPFGLYPIWAHPVLPGETLESCEVKLRAISQPIKNPLVGSWLESWLFYCKFTDIDRNLGGMFISDTFSTTGYLAAADAPRYFVKAGQIDWIRLVTERIHQAYFRHENEAIRTTDGVPMIKINAQHWMQNLLFKPADVVPSATSVGAQANQLNAFEMMQLMSMSELTYEKYLEQFGVQSISTNIGEPELLRFTRSWTTPVNTVEPTTGVPSSAWIWSDEIKSAKPKRFDEPGFLIFLMAVRPKVFLKNQAASMIGNLWGFSDWFPVYNLEDPAMGVKDIVSTDPVFLPAWSTGGPFNLIYDHKDLLSHGEQFVNAVVGDMPYPIPFVGRPTVAVGSEPEDLRSEYMVQTTDVDSWFVGTTAPTKRIAFEGIGNVSISGHITDTTVGNMAGPR